MSTTLTIAPAITVSTPPTTAIIVTAAPSETSDAPQSEPSPPTQSLVNLKAEPHLPPEIEREIFEVSARDGRGQAVTLLRVAQRVKIWIEPLLYRVISWNEGSTSGKPCNCSQVPPEISVARYAHHVRHLLIASGRMHKELQDYLTLCTGVEDLAVWSNLSLETLKGLETWPLRRLSFSFDGLFAQGLRLDSPLFAQVTHLDIVDYDGCESWDTANNLAMVSNLTHVAFNEVVHKNLVLGVLKHCENLRVLMLLDSRQVTDEYDEDPRVLRSDDVKIGSDTPRHDWIADWRLGTEGGLDFWARADRVVAARLAKAQTQETTEATSDAC